MDAQSVLAAAPLAVLGTFLPVLSAIDLADRDASQIVGGSKIVSGGSLFAIPVGPIAYRWSGRKRAPLKGG